MKPEILIGRRLMFDPNRLIIISSQIVPEVNPRRLHPSGNWELPAPLIFSAGPGFPLGNSPLNQLGSFGVGQDRPSQSFMNPQPGIERQTVVSLFPAILGDTHIGELLFPGGPDR